MLNPEQTIIRRLENENRLLREKNEKLQNKITEIRKGLAGLVREMAKSMNFVTRAKMNKLADEIDNLD